MPETPKLTTKQRLQIQRQKMTEQEPLLRNANFNEVNLGLPENNVDVPTAGSIKTAKNPRTMQVGLRFEF